MRGKTTSYRGISFSYGGESENNTHDYTTYFKEFILFIQRETEINKRKITTYSEIQVGSIQETATSHF